MTPAHVPALAVLDTNVVLDLWLFKDPRTSPLRQALETGQVRALVTPAMRAELADVLTRPFAQAHRAQVDTVLAALQACSAAVLPATPQAPFPPRCTDADDQKFIDLAWCWPARWLVSRDRAVLKLARAARARQLHILTPEVWAAARLADGVAEADPS